jgi:hypothetical protein
LQCIISYFQAQRSFEEVSQEITLQTAMKKALAVPALSEKRKSTSELQYQQK